MKPYGLPRTLELENPDLGDIRRYGLPTHPGEGSRSAASKASVRRYWKRQARVESRSLCNPNTDGQE